MPLQYKSEGHCPRRVPSRPCSRLTLSASTFQDICPGQNPIRWLHLLLRSDQVLPLNHPTCTRALINLAGSSKGLNAANSGRVVSLGALKLDDSGINQQSLDAQGNCRINIFNTVLGGSINRQHPYSRCYVCTSSDHGVTTSTSGYALDSTHVITTDLHTGRSSVTISRIFSTTNADGSETVTSDSAISPANAWVVWDEEERNANRGLKYCILRTESPLSIDDSEGSHTWTNLTSVLSITSNPELFMLTRRVPTGELISCTSSDPPQLLTNTNTAANYFSTTLGGYVPQGNNDYLLGSPIFVVQTEQSPFGGPVTTSYSLVGIADRVVETEPCLVNAAIFVSDNGVQALLNALHT